MAQGEDTELRDLVTEALEKNGSLAKIRALLRANIFMCFENEREQTRHNEALDTILLIPEGKLALNLITEFLEYANLKHSLLIFKSESRQGTGYSYEGRHGLLNQFSYLKPPTSQKEPLLVTILKYLLMSPKKNYFEKQDNNHDIECMHSMKAENFKKDDNNSTYIVHDDSSSLSQSNSHSEASSTDKNKLMLRLPHDNSDTDTSSDSNRDKLCSEYIANENICIDGESDDDKKIHYVLSPKTYIEETDKLSPCSNQSKDNRELLSLNALNSSSCSSYKKPLNLSNTDTIGKQNDSPEEIHMSNSTESFDSQGNVLIKTIGSQSLQSSKPTNVIQFVGSQFKPISSTRSVSEKSDLKSPSYSYDFVDSPDKDDANIKSPKSIETESIQEDLSLNSSPKGSDNSLKLQSSQSSVSLSDIADLIESPSPKSRNSYKPKEASILNSPKEDKISLTKNDSEISSASPIQSLSNLSMDFHSD